jgi:hypothetical protein
METITIDTTPSWQTLVSMGLKTMEDPDADRELVEAFKSELMRLAKMVDDQNEQARKNTWTTLDMIVEEERKKGNLI